MIRIDASPDRLAGGNREACERSWRCGATTWPGNMARRGGWPAVCNDGLDLLAWGQKYLPDHFRRPPSNMHRWLAEQLDAAPDGAGNEAQRARPARRRQIDHRHPLPAAPRGRRVLGTLHLDRLRHQTPGLRPSGEHQGRTARKPAAGRGLSRGRRAWAGVAGQLDRAPQRRDDRGLRHGPANPRPPPPPAPAHADRLRRLAERRAHRLGLAARAFADLVPRHADEGRHCPDQRRQPGHGPAPRGPGHGTAPHARLDLADLQVDRPLAGEHLALAAVGGRLHRSRPPQLSARPRDSSTSRIARRWTPARSCSGPRKKTSTR